MQRLCSKLTAQVRGDLVALALGLRKHDGLLALAIYGDQVHQHARLGLLGHLARQRGDGVTHTTGFTLTDGIHSDRVFEELACNVLDPKRQSSGEEQRLALLRNAGQDLLHVLAKSDGKHLVRLVKNDVRDLAEVEVAAIDEVDDAPRRAHHDICAALQLEGLVADRHTTVEAAACKLGRNAGKLFLHLLGQLTGGRQHEAQWRAAAAGAVHL
mmetsp:Transcript_27761/g.69767  ORF Transcript_27761/g.69767 Transcript_27761/m.69767 type:complete len:213 (-) Transcript_27761:11-649(-)